MANPSAAKNTARDRASSPGAPGGVRRRARLGREESLHVVEASRGGVASRGFVKREESLPALARRARGGIVQQIRFRREALQDGHRDARCCA